MKFLLCWFRIKFGQYAIIWKNVDREPLHNMASLAHNGLMAGSWGHVHVWSLQVVHENWLFCIIGVCYCWIMNQGDTLIDRCRNKMASFCRRHFKCVFLWEKCDILMQIPSKFLLKGSFNKISRIINDCVLRDAYLHILQRSFTGK